MRTITNANVALGKLVQQNKGGRQMKIRVMGALLAVAVFLPFLIVGGPWFAWFIFVLGAIGLYEIARMKNIKFISIIGIISIVALSTVLLPPEYISALMPVDDPQFIFYVCGMLLLTLTVYQHKTFNFVDAATLMFGALYVGFGFRFLINMREMGLETIIYQLIVIWATDTGAYLVGRKIGKVPLAPEISPNKTVEGSIGGIVLALIASSLYINLFKPNLGQLDHIWILTILMSIVGQYGDLVESAYKRHFNVKDSGKLIPGHGGVLDRFDSMIFTSFMFMIWLNLM